MLTSKTVTKTTKAAKTTGARGNNDLSERLAQRNPRPMPKKLPMRTKFEK